MRARHAPAYLAARIAPATAFQPPIYKGLRTMKHLSDRAEKELRAIDEYSDPNQALRDMLADLRHYADTHAIDFAKCDRAAYQHYVAERAQMPVNPMDTSAQTKESGL